MIAMRTHKIVFLMITLAFGQVCWAFAAQNTTILRGWSGIRGIRPFVIYGINFNQYQNFYWASLVLFCFGNFHSLADFKITFWSGFKWHS